jgi:hypothetical protein
MAVIVLSKYRDFGISKLLYNSPGELRQGKNGSSRDFIEEFKYLNTLISLFNEINPVMEGRGDRRMVFRSHGKGE